MKIFLLCLFIYLCFLFKKIYIFFCSFLKVKFLLFRIIMQSSKMMNNFPFWSGKVGLQRDGNYFHDAFFDDQDKAALYCVCSLWITQLYVYSIYKTVFEMIIKLLAHHILFFLFFVADESLETGKPANLKILTSKSVLLKWKKKHYPPLSFNLQTINSYKQNLF